LARFTGLSALGLLFSSMLREQHALVSEVEKTTPLQVAQLCPLFVDHV